MPVQNSWKAKTRLPQRVTGTMFIPQAVAALLLAGCALSVSRFASAEAHRTVVTTERAIVTRVLPICCVLHTADDNWCFLADYSYGNSAFIDISVTTTLDVIIRLDSTVTQLASLPEGWRADRKSKKDPWVLSELKENQ